MWLLLTAVSSLACSRLPPVEHPIDADSADVVAPAAPVVGIARIYRGSEGTDFLDDCTAVVSSCADGGGVVLAVSASDDATPADALGWRVELSGDLPDGLVELPIAVRADDDGEVSLAWVDGQTDDQEAFSFTARVYAVDAAGNESAPTDVLVEDPGSVAAPYAPCEPVVPEPVGPGGCATTGAAAGAWWVAALLALARRRL